MDSEVSQIVDVNPTILRRLYDEMDEKSYYYCHPDLEKATKELAFIEEDGAWVNLTKLPGFPANWISDSEIKKYYEGYWFRKLVTSFDMIPHRVYQKLLNEHTIVVQEKGRPA